MTASKTLRPMRISYVVVGLPLLVLAAFNAYLGLYVVARFMDVIWGVSGPLLASLAWMFWVSSHRIVFDGRTVTYRHTLFRDEFEISSVKSVKFESGIRKYTDRFRPFSRVIFKLSDRDRPVYINATLFSRADLRALAESCHSTT
jgi:hypothetical protein